MTPVLFYDLSSLILRVRGLDLGKGFAESGGVEITWTTPRWSVKQGATGHTAAARMNKPGGNLALKVFNTTPEYKRYALLSKRQYDSVGAVGMPLVMQHPTVGDEVRDTAIFLDAPPIIVNAEPAEVTLNIFLPNARELASWGLAIPG